MQYLGDFAEDATVYMPFNTFSSDDPQASVTITNLADADIKVYKDGSVTQIVTDGATIAIDFDSITGNHLITIDTSAHADYSVGSDYIVRIEGTTVDGGTINAFIGSFSIENRFDNDTAKASALTTVDTVVDGIQTDLSNATDGLGAIKTAVDANGTSISGLNDVSAADVNAQCDAAIETYGLDHLIAAAVSGTDITDNSIIAKMVSKSATADWDSFDNTTDSLESITDSGGGGLTQQQVRDAMKLAPTAGAPSAGSIDEHVDDILSDTNELQTDDIPTTLATLATSSALATVDTNVDAILVDTGTDIPATLVTIAGYIDTEIATIITNLATVDAVVDGIQTDLSNGTDGLGALKTLIDTLDTVADAIKAKTDQLVFTKANELDANVQSINGATITGDGNGTPFDVV